MSVGDLAAARRRLVEELREKVALKSDRVAAALEAVPRELFVPAMPLDRVYTDTPFVTHREGHVPTSSASQPAIVAAMLDLLDVQPGDRVLEVGAGTGYNAALLAELVGGEGYVASIELQPDVAAEAREHLAAAGYDGVQVVAGDAAAGHVSGAPYDRIIATASVWETPPAWVGQLREGGRVVMPLRLNAMQVVMALERDGDALAGVDAVAGGFTQLRGAAGRRVTAEVCDGIEVTSDAALDAGSLGLLRERWDTGEPMEFALPTEASAPFDFFTYLSLQGAPLAGAVRYPMPERPGGSWLLLVPSPHSVLRFQTHEPQRTELLGERDALVFAQAALLRWRMEGEPTAAALRARIAPIEGGNSRASHAALPAPVAGRYRYRRGTHAYELWYATPDSPSPAS